MCGILGYIGNIPKNYNEEAFDFLKFLFVSSKVRGTDASGFSSIHLKNPKLITEKRPVSADKFVHSSLKFRALKSAMPSIFIGHTRAKTTGRPDRSRNNHPFNSNRYSLVHNGHISDWKDLAKKRNLNMRTETDSEVLIHLVSEKDVVFDGIRNIVESVDKYSKIAIAILQHTAPNRLILFRTNNPTAIMLVPAWKAIFFASTQEILNDALKSMYGSPAWQDKKKQYGIDIKDVPDWKASEFSFDEDGDPKISAHVDIDKPSTSAPIHNYNPKTPPPLPPSASGYKVAPPQIGMTGERLASCSDTARRAVSTTTDAISDLTEIMNLISTSPFMTDKEISHYKKYLHDSKV